MNQPRARLGLVRDENTLISNEEIFGIEVHGSAMESGGYIFGCIAANAETNRDVGENIIPLRLSMCLDYSTNTAGYVSADNMDLLIWEFVQ